ncbi:MAG TPA: RICIN domain-containing protein [Arthrobacter sp.]
MTCLSQSCPDREHGSLRSQSGAFDLPSIGVGVLVVGVMALGVMAVVFGIIPFAQDNGARQDLSAIRTAEGTARVQSGKFLSAAELASARYLPANASIDVSSDAEGSCYLAVSRSATGTIFFSTHDTNEPRELTPKTPTGICVAAAATQAMADKISGYRPSMYASIGTGDGTPASPGRGVLDPAPGDAAKASPVKIIDLTVTGTTVPVNIQNAGAAATAGYTATVACLDTASGAVTVEQIQGSLALGAGTSSGLPLVGCLPGAQPIGADVRASAGDAWVNTASWQAAYVHSQATTVTRGVVVSPTGLFCFENAGNAAVNGNRINLAACADESSQRWQWSGDGAFAQATLANKCLGVPNAALITAQPAVLSGCDGSDAQSFKAVKFQGNPAVSGMIQIVQKSTGLCVDVTGGQLIPGMQLATSTCSGTPSQSWYMPGLGGIFNPQIPAPASSPALVPTVPGPAMTAHASYKPDFEDRTVVAGDKADRYFLFTLPGTATDYTVVWTESGLAGIGGAITPSTGAYGGASYWVGRFNKVPGTDGLIAGQATMTATATRNSDGLISTKTFNITVKNDAFTMIENTTTLADNHFQDLTAITGSMKNYTSGGTADMAFALGIDNMSAYGDYTATYAVNGADSVNAIVTPTGSSYYLYWGADVRPKDTIGYTAGTMTVDITLTHKTGSHASATKRFTFNVVDSTTTLAFAPPISLWSPASNVATYAVGLTNSQTSMFAVSAVQQSFMVDYTVTWSGDFAALNAAVTPGKIETYNNQHWYLGLQPKTGGLTAGSIPVTATMKYNPTGAVITKTFTMTVK